MTIEFDQNILSSSNILDKANALKLLFQMGAITPNEIRTAFNIPVPEDEYSNYTWLQKQNAPLQKYDEYNSSGDVNSVIGADN